MTVRARLRVGSRRSFDEPASASLQLPCDARVSAPDTLALQAALGSRAQPLARLGQSPELFVSSLARKKGRKH
jgi:hypothetical protein